jgi:spermidine synthase
VRHLAGVEIDAAVIAFAQKHFPEIAKPVLTDTRFQSVIATACAHAAATGRRFDLIIVDSTNPQDRESSIYWKILRRRAARKAGDFATRYWMLVVHAATFALPRFVAHIVAKAQPQASSTKARANSRP